MPESHGVTVRHQHAAVQALVDRGQRLPRHGDEEAHLGPPAEHRGRRRDVPAAPREPDHAGEHGIAHGGRYLVGPGREHLGEVERVPAGALECRVGVQGRARCVQELPHARGGQRGQLHPDDAGQPGQIAHHHGQRVITAHLLGAECGQDHQPDPGQAAAQVAQDVQGGLVGPVDVLEQEQHRGSGQRLAHVPEQPEPAHTRLVVHRRDQLGQGIQDRAQRLGGRDVVAGAAPHRHTGGVGEGRGERGLADARFAAQEHQPAAAVKRLAEQSLQRRQEARPLDQHTSH